MRPLASRQPFALALVSVALLVACGGPLDPERNGGTDQNIKHAKKIALDGKARGDLSYTDGIRTQWKTFTLDQDADLVLTLDSKLPTEDANLVLKLFDPNLNPIGDDLQANPDAPVVQPYPNLVAGKYFLVVYAPKHGDAGTYTITFKVTPHGAAGADGTPPPPLLAAMPTGPSPLGGAASAPAAQVPGHIIQVQRSGAYTVLVLDVGTNAGIRAGSHGIILDATNAPVQGSDFVVNPRRLGANQAVATTKLPPDQITSTQVEITP